MFQSWPIDLRRESVAIEVGLSLRGKHVVTVIFPIMAVSPVFRVEHIDHGEGSKSTAISQVIDSKV